MGRDSTATRTTGNTATTFILNLLEPGVNYSIAVAARNSAGIGNFSQPTEAQTIAERKQRSSCVDAIVQQ